MHDPMVVAHTIPFPWPKRAKHLDRFESGGWGLTRRRRTNPENQGEPTFPFWRLTGWRLRLGGRAYRMPKLATIWHVEPGGRDAFTVCKRTGQWRWHVRHWHVQVHLGSSVRRWLIDRCGECGRRFEFKEHRFGYMSSDKSYHEPCMNLRQVRSQLDDATKYIAFDANDTQRWRVERRLDQARERADG